MQGAAAYSALLNELTNSWIKVSWLVLTEYVFVALFCLYIQKLVYRRNEFGESTAFRIYLEIIDFKYSFHNYRCFG